MSRHDTVIYQADHAWDQDDADAVRDCELAASNGWRSVGYNPGSNARTEYNKRAYRAERAFAIYLGVTNWVRNPLGFRTPDVLGWSVRMASRPGYGLVIHNRDGDYPYALVEDNGDFFRIAGTMTRAKAIELQSAGVGFRLPGSTNPWCIQQRHLSPPPPPLTLGPIRSPLADSSMGPVFP